MKVTVYIVQAFCADGEGGNLAGVVLDARNLTDGQKQAIAREVGHSETAFVEQSKVADFKVRFFTPEGEVELCGHATIATYWLLFSKKLLPSGRFTQETKAGVLSIEVLENGEVWMEQLLPVFEELASLSKLQLCISHKLSKRDPPPQIVFTGLRDIILPLQNRAELNSLVINTINLSSLNQHTNTIGLHAFTLAEDDSQVVAYTRNFAPLYGISEESATGSSNGALACFLYHHGILAGKNIHKLEFIQGYMMNQASKILVSLDTRDKLIQRVQVGGSAKLLCESTVEV